MEKTLAERIAEERLEKVAAIQRTVKSLAKNPESVNSNLVIQRNLRWTDEQKSSLIESVLLGYPIPPIYTLRSEDRQLWLIDGKQRVDGSFIRYVNDEWELTGLDLVYGLDINNLKFSQLPEELRELIADQNLTFYQFEKLTTDQRDSLFKRLNSGTALSSIELIRSILGTEMLEYIDKLFNTGFIKKAQLTDKQLDKYVEVELILQTIAIITGRTRDMSGKKMKELAIELRVNGLTEDEKYRIETVYDYLSDAFADISDKTAKTVLKKADIIGIVGAAWESEEKPEVFANLLVPYILNQKSGSMYTTTKRDKSASPDSVSKRIQILQGVVGVAKLEKEERGQQAEMDLAV